jgi:hypothetical protein
MVKICNRISSGLRCTRNPRKRIRREGAKKTGCRRTSATIWPRFFPDLPMSRSSAFGNLLLLRGAKSEITNTGEEQKPPGVFSLPRMIYAVGSANTNTFGFERESSRHFRLATIRVFAPKSGR